MPQTPAPTATETAILQVLWQQGPSTVRQIHNALRAQRRTGYSTTLKMVQVMIAKKLLLKDDSVRPQIFRPSQPQNKTQLQLIDELIQRAFAGSASNLVLRAAAAKRVTPQELTEIKRLIEQSKGDQP